MLSTPRCLALGGSGGGYRLDARRVTAKSAPDRHDVLLSVQRHGALRSRVTTASAISLRAIALAASNNIPVPIES